MSSELRQTIAAAIRRSLWTCWGDHVPDGDASLASLSDAGQAGYADAADAVIAVLPPAITAGQREALTHNERVAIENAIDLCLQRHWHYEASVIRALAAGHPS